MVQASWRRAWEVAWYVILLAAFDLMTPNQSICVLLGYGATTFPGLTEALVFDKNVTLAQEEADRLQSWIDALAKDLKP